MEIRKTAGLHSKQKNSMLDPLYSANTLISKKVAKQVADAIIKSSTKKSK